METSSATNDLQRLQSCVNDLISVQALAVMWRGQKPERIVATLLEVLVRMLRLDFAYSKIADSGDGPSIEVLRQPPPRQHSLWYSAAAPPGRDLDMHEVGCSLERRLSCDPGNTFGMPNPLGEGEMSIALFRFGVQEEMGIVAAASRRSDFPTPVETLLFRVAGNQAAIALQEARRLHEQKRAADELERRVAQRTEELTAVNLKLRKEIIERQHAEAEQRKFASLVANSTDFIGIATLDGQALFVNRAGQELVGLEDHWPKSISEYVMEEDREKLQRQILPMLERDGHWAGELCFNHFKSRTPIPMLMQLFFIKEPGSDRRLAMATISRDISERKRAEQVLKESEERFRSLIEGVKDYAIFSLDTEGRVTSWNAGAERLKGYRAAEILGAHFSCFYRADEIAAGKPEELLKRAAAKGRAEDQGWRLRKDGTRFWADVLITAQRNEEGRLVGFSKLTRDITERKRGEAELMGLKDELAGDLKAMTRLHELGTRLHVSTKLQALLEEVLDAMIELLNADFGNVQLYDPKTKVLEIVAQRGFTEEFSEDFNEVREGTAACGTALLRRERVIVADVRTEPSFAPHLKFVEAAGYRALQSTPLFSRNGEPLGTISTHFRHVHRPSERELRFADLYARQAAEAIETQQVEESLREKQEELTRVSRVVTIGELAASIAHEVNQPLAALLTNANAGLRWLGAATPDLDEAKNALRRIVRDGNRAGDVISRIRMLVQKSGTAHERVGMKDAIDEIIALVQAEIRRREVALRTECADDLPAVMGDRVQLQQVLLNLIMNGIDAVSAVSDRSREIVVAAVEEPAGKISVAVRDSGIGIEPQNLERVFETFYTTKLRGIGIGLSISRSIIEAHGGRLWAARNDGAGTTFQFTLPVYRAGVA
jgi:PAS domain S-box-containing protein